MIYSKLDKKSKCIGCVGCSLLEQYWFKGKSECKNFQDGYTVEEKVRKEFGNGNEYGSIYGNNN